MLLRKTVNMLLFDSIVALLTFIEHQNFRLRREFLLLRFKLEKEENGLPSEAGL